MVSLFNLLLSPVRGQQTHGGADRFPGLHVVARLPGTGHERLRGWGVKPKGNRWERE